MCLKSEKLSKHAIMRKIKTTFGVYLFLTLICLRLCETNMQNTLQVLRVCYDIREFNKCNLMLLFRYNS